MNKTERANSQNVDIWCAIKWPWHSKSDYGCQPKATVYLKLGCKRADETVNAWWFVQI